jgi:pimeloyl-ACP methyl ester carboxylesterase
MRNPAPSKAMFLVGAVLMAACGSSDGPADGRSGAEPTDTETADVVASTPPAVTPGAIAVGAVDIGDSTIEYVTAVPDDFEVGAGVPVLLAFPPGGQDLGLTRRLVEGTYAAEAGRLGWVVVSPAAPDGVTFFDGSEELLPGLVDWLDSWVEAEGGAPHVAGVSNGGISAFRYAAGNPDEVRSIVTFPGFARSDADLDGLEQLVDVPIRMFVGETDTSWVGAAEDTLAAAQAVGLDADLTVFPGEGHIMTSTADGVLIFEQLESFR